MGEIDDMPVAEYIGWQEYYAVEPFGDLRGDMRSAMISATLANVHRGEHAAPYALADFMPFLDRQPVKQEVIGDELDDEARSNLILASCFGITMEQ